MTIDSGLTVPYRYDGTFKVSNGDDEITLNIDITAVSVNATDIYSYRGNIKDRGY
jgi:hypothetical protein